MAIRSQESLFYRWGIEFPHCGIIPYSIHWVQPSTYSHLDIGCRVVVAKNVYGFTFGSKYGCGFGNEWSFRPGQELNFNSSQFLKPFGISNSGWIMF